MWDELKQQSIGDDPEFSALLNDLYEVGLFQEGTDAQKSRIKALIAHIDAWGARLAESKVVGREHLNRFIDGYCLGRSDLIACTEAAFFYFNKVASGQADNEASA
jgi:hypothetical protein